jgi:hypothetical protein
MKPSEKYAQRWREKAARARPPLRRKRDDQDLRRYILKNPYFDRMIGSTNAVLC